MPGWPPRSRQLDDDEDLLGQMVAVFRESTPQLLGEIGVAIANKDAVGLARFAHALLSSLGAFGADEAYRLTHELEEMGRWESLQEALGTFRALQGETGTLAPRSTTCFVRPRSVTPVILSNV